MPTMNEAATSATVVDPIDVLVPPPRPWWIRLAVATMLILTVGAVGYGWNYGLLRPSPDCCGSGDSSAQIGLSDIDGAVTVTGYFFNSSPRAVSIVGAHADLPGARVLDIRPYADPLSWEMPPENLAVFPYVAAGPGNVRFAISFVPDRCVDDGGDWGTLSLDLEVAGDHLYPTLGRTYELPDAIVSAEPNGFSVLPPARLDDAFTNIGGPLQAACILLGR
jgi:hypothetical protein